MANAVVRSCSALFVGAQALSLHAPYPHGDDSNTQPKGKSPPLRFAPGTVDDGMDRVSPTGKHTGGKKITKNQSEEELFLDLKAQTVSAYHSSDAGEGPTGLPIDAAFQGPPHLTPERSDAATAIALLSPVTSPADAASTQQQVSTDELALDPTVTDAGIAPAMSRQVSTDSAESMDGGVYDDENHEEAAASGLLYKLYTKGGRRKFTGDAQPRPGSSGVLLSKKDAKKYGLEDFVRDDINAHGRKEVYGSIAQHEQSFTYLVKAKLTCKPGEFCPETTPVQDENYRLVTSFGTTGAIARAASATSFDMTYVWPKSPSTLKEQDDFATDLRKSLSVTMEKFPVVAGRLDRNGNMVKCNNAGVTFRIQRLEGSAEWLPQQPDRDVLCDLPNPSKKLSGKHPLATFVLTFFNEGGATLGVTISHAIADGPSFVSFMEEWSNIHAGKELSYTPSLDTPALYPEYSLEDIDQASEQRGLIKATAWQNFWITRQIRSDMAKYIRGYDTDRVSIIFSKEEVTAMRDDVVERMRQRGHPDPWITSNEVLNAYLQSIMIQLLRLPRGASKWKSTTQTVDLRGKFGFPKKHFGNLVVSATVDLNFEKVRPSFHFVHQNILNVK